MNISPASRSFVRYAPLLALTTSFCIHQAAWGQAFTVTSDGLHRVSAFDVSAGGADTQLNTALETGGIWAAIDAGAAVPGTVAANATTYNIGAFANGTVASIDYVGGGDFGVNRPLNSIPPGTVPAGSPVEDLSVRARTYLAVPVGNWSISIASDDGRLLTMSDAQSGAAGAGGVAGFTTFNGSGDQIDGGTGSGFNNIRFNGTTGHNQTVGTFTVSAANVEAGTNVALMFLDGFYFERGTGGGSFEISIRNVADTVFDSAAEGWQLLADNTFGWRISSAPITVAIAAPTGERTFNAVNANWTDPNVFNTGAPGPSGVAAPTPTATDNVFVPSGTANVTTSQAALNLDIASTLGSTAGGGVVSVNAGGALAIGGNITVGNTGTLTVNGGTVTAALINSTGTTNLTNGGTLTTSGSLGTLNLTGAGTLGGAGVLTSTTTVLNAGTLNLPGGATLTLGNVSGDSITMNGTGAVILPNANTYTGVTTVNGGTLRLGNNAALGVEGTAASRTVINNGATLDIRGFRAGATGNELVEVQGAGVGGQGAIINTAGQQTNAFKQVALTGNATFRTDSRFDIRDGSNPTTFNMGGFTLTKVGGQEFALNNTTITNPGSVNVNQGIFRLEGTTAFGGTGIINVSGGNTLDFFNNSQTHTAGITLQTNANLTANNGGTPVLAGPLVLAGQGNVTNSAQVTVSGPVSGAGGLVKAGTGRLVLTNAANTNTGAVAVNAGTVEATSTGALGNSSGYNVASGATLELSGTGTSFAAPVTRPIAINGAGAGGTGALRSSGDSKTITGPVTLPTSATITNATAATTLTVAGPVTLANSANLSIDGPGNTVISTAFGNGNVTTVTNAIRETYFDSQNNGIDIQTNIEGFRALPLGANDYRGLLTTNFSFASDADFDNRAAAGGVAGFDPENNPGGDDFSALFTTTFTPTVSGTYQFRSDLIDDQATFFIDTGGTPGVFDSTAERFINFTGFTGAGTTGTTPALTAGTSYLLGIALRDTGSGSALRNVQYSVPGSGGVFVNVDPSLAANAGLFTVSETPSNSLIKTGTGIATLMGANTYNGGTTINGGAILANNTTGSGTGSGNVTVNNGGFLGGNGFVGLASTVTNINSGGTLSPGGAANSPLFGVGTLTFQGGVNLASGSTALMQLNSTTLNVGSFAALAALTDPANGLGAYDQAIVNGALAFASGSNVSLDLTGYTPRFGDVFDLFDFTGANLGVLPSFTLLNSTLGNGFVVDTSRFLDLGVIAIVPEPSRALLLLAGVCTLTARRRRRVRA